MLFEFYLESGVKLKNLDVPVTFILHRTDASSSLLQKLDKFSNRGLATSTPDQNFRYLFYHQNRLSLFKSNPDMAVQVERRRFTVQDYYKMAEAGILKPEDRVELINGEIIKMSPIKSQHAGHVTRLNTLLSKLIGDYAIVSIQNPVRIDNFSEPEPDIALLKPVSHFYIESHPGPKDVFLLIEVADSTLRYDQKVKLKLYAQAGIPEVWIVNLQARCVEVYRQPESGSYLEREIVNPDGVLRLAAFDLSFAASAVI
jgi:Uma2 family endonuclease